LCSTAKLTRNCQLWVQAVRKRFSTGSGATLMQACALGHILNSHERRIRFLCYARVILFRVFTQSGSSRDEIRLTGLRLQSTRKRSAGKVWHVQNGQFPPHPPATQNCRSLRLLVLDRLRQCSAKRCARASTPSLILAARSPRAATRPPDRALQRPPSTNATSLRAPQYSTRSSQIPIATGPRPTAPTRPRLPRHTSRGFLPWRFSDRRPARRRTSAAT
jgi:hypothetical protein